MKRGTNGEPVRRGADERFIEVDRKADFWRKASAEGERHVALDSPDIAREIENGVSRSEIVDVYLPIAKLLLVSIESRARLRSQVSALLDVGEQSVPFVVGIGGSVAVGKTTMATVLRALLASMDLTVSLVTTDGFLRSTRDLEREGLLARKGFPESFDQEAIRVFLHRLKSGDPRLTCPVYSHSEYDVVRGEEALVHAPDVLIFEGVSVLQSGEAPEERVRWEFLDLSIYIDSEEEFIVDWYLDRVDRLCEAARHDPSAYFHRFRHQSDEERRAYAKSIWNSVNRVNLRDHIQPNRELADIIVFKDRDHSVSGLRVRKL